MDSILHALLAFLMLTEGKVSLIQNEEGFDGRWVTRPPEDKEFPYAVFIEMSNAEDKICSGTLIALNWVLTAARCMYSKKRELVEKDTSLIIYAGVDDDVNNTHVQKRKSRKLLIHQRPGTDSYYSLALVKLEVPFLAKNKGKKVQPAVVVDYFFSYNNKYACKSGSYGRILWEVDRNPALKKTISVTQLCNCTKALIEAFPKGSANEWVCGQYDYNIGVCLGDFGAGLVCDGTLVAVPIGIVELKDSTSCNITDRESEECGKVSTVTVYVDLCYHLKWVHKFVPAVPVNKKRCDATGSAEHMHLTSYPLDYVYYFVTFMFSQYLHFAFT